MRQRLRVAVSRARQLQCNFARVHHLRDSGEIASVTAFSALGRSLHDLAAVVTRSAIEVTDCRHGLDPDVPV